MSETRGFFAETWTTLNSCAESNCITTPGCLAEWCIAMLLRFLYPPLAYGEKTVTTFSFWGELILQQSHYFLQDCKSATHANLAAVVLFLIRWNHKTSGLYAQTLWHWIPSSLPAQGWMGASPGYSLAQTLALLLGPTELWDSQEQPVSQSVPVW